jgi:hypothetical protein
VQRWYQYQLTEVPAFLLLAATTPFSNKCGACPRLNGFRDHPTPATLATPRSSYVFFFSRIPSPGKASVIMSSGSSIRPITHLPITQLVLAPRGESRGLPWPPHQWAATTWNPRIAKFHQPCLGQLACSPGSLARNQSSRPGVLCLSLYARRRLVVVPKPSLGCQSFLFVSRRCCPPAEFSPVLLCCRKETLTRNTRRSGWKFDSHTSTCTLHNITPNLVGHDQFSDECEETRAHLSCLR